MDSADKAFLGRVDRLRGDLEAVQGRLWAQHDVLLRLRSDAASLKDQYASLQERAATALEALKVAEPEASAPALDPSPRPPQEPVPAATLETRFYDDAPAPRAPRLWLPYAALALAGIAMMLAAPRLYGRRVLAPPSAPAPEAVRAVLPIDFAANSVPPPAPIDGEVGRREADEALKLVYEFIPPGSRRPIRELLRSEISAGARPDEASPWIVEPAGDGRFLVTLRPGGDAASAPVYEFEVDTARRSVEPSQETETDLQNGSRLAARG